MDYLMSASFACECRHGKHSNDWTPWELGWPRTVYERVVPRFWPILTRGVLPVLPDGRYSVTDLCARFDDAVKAFVELVAADDQELFLDAAGFPFLEEPGPVVWGCHCRWCAMALRYRTAERRIPRATRLRQEFEEQVAEHLELVLVVPNAYDRRLGAPALLRGHQQREVA